MKTLKAIAAAAALVSGLAAVAGGESAEVKVLFYSPKTARIIKMPEGSGAEEPTHRFKTVIAQPLRPRSPAYSIAHSREGAIYSYCRNPGDEQALIVRLNVTTGEVKFNAGGSALLAEDGAAKFYKRDYNGVKGIGAGQGWSLAKDEPLYGLGDNQTRELNVRSWSGRLMPGNVGDGLAAVVSPRGWAILWDNTSPVHVHSDDAGFAFESELGDAVDYYFIAGGSIDGCIAEIRALTGDVPMMPRWAYGFWQSKERYKSQDETIGVLKKYRELGIPLDGIVQDWQYWGNNYLWNAMEFTGETFPDPKRFVDEVHRMNARMIITIWQSFGPATKQYRELSAKGLLFPFETWPSSGLGHIWPPRLDYPSGVRLYDNYSAEARDIYWNNLKRLFDLGFDGWWMDSTDPDHIYKEGDFEHTTSLGCTWREVRSAYPVSATEAVYERMRKATDRRVFLLTRGAGLGEQRYAASVWSGDTGSSWDVLRRQIPGGLNYTMTGNPHFNCDLGGFFAGRYKRGGGVKNENWRELYVRWMQLGTFLPMMRSHGTDIPREVFLYGKKGEPVYDALVAAIELRYEIMPYIYSLGAELTRGRASFMRPLAAEFPEDEAAWNISDEFMMGRSILVAPVLRAMYTSEDNSPVGEMEGWNKPAGGEAAGGGEPGAASVYLAKRWHEVYLPKGADWWLLAGVGQTLRFAGGARVKIDVNLMSQPVFAKSGSVIPLGPRVQYNGEKPWDKLKIMVCPGADGEFSLYEDDFETYSYERGEYSVVKFKWHDASRTLTICAREGAYPGMLEKREFIVGSADAITSCITPNEWIKKTRKVVYDGREVHLSL